MAPTNSHIYVEAMLWCRFLLLSFDDKVITCYDFREECCASEKFWMDDFFFGTVKIRT